MTQRMEADFEPFDEHSALPAIGRSVAPRAQPTRRRLRVRQTAATCSGAIFLLTIVNAADANGCRGFITSRRVSI